MGVGETIALLPETESILVCVQAFPSWISDIQMSVPMALFVRTNKHLRPIALVIHKHLPEPSWKLDAL